MGRYELLPLNVSDELGVMIMKKYSPFPKFKTGVCSSEAV